MAGRKSLKDEIQVIRRYAELAEPYFKFIKEMLEGEDKDDRKWAAERLDKALPKMIPQDLDLTTGGLPLILPSEIINKNALDTDPGAEGNSEGHTQVSGS